MELKHVIPDLKLTFGNLEFAGEKSTNLQRGRVESRTYNLYSDLQRADNIEVTIPVVAGTKNFKSDELITLINPRLTIKGERIDNKEGYADYIMFADDMIRVEERTGK